eukprot:1157751-Pelagomonas_calceolata.AAC.3
MVYYSKAQQFASLERRKGNKGRKARGMPEVSLCGGVPRVWGQKPGKIPAKMGSPGSCPPGLPDQQRWLALVQEHNLRGPGGWGRGPENRSPTSNSAGKLAS